MGTPKTLTRFAFTLVFILALVLSFPLISSYFNSYLENHIESLLEKHRVKLNYQNIRWEGLGVRVSNIEILRDNLHAKGSLYVEWSILNGFTKPRILNLDDWTVIRNTADPSHAPHKASTSPEDSVQNAWKIWKTNINTFFGQEINIRFRNLNLHLYDESRSKLLMVKNLSGELKAEQNEIIFTLKKLTYRSKPVLFNLQGQLIHENSSDTYTFLIAAEDNEQGQWQIQGKIKDDFNSIELRHKRVGIPSVLSPYLSFLTPKDRVQLLFKVNLSNLNDFESIRFNIQALTNNVSFQHPMLGDDAWGPFPVSLQGQGLWNLKTGSIDISNGKIFLIPTRDPDEALRAVFTSVKKDILASMEQDPWRIYFQVPTTNCDTLRRSLPTQVWPFSKDLKLEGALALKLRLSLLNKDSPPIDWDPQQQTFDCSILKTPSKFTRATLKSRNASIFTIDELQNMSVKAFLSDRFVTLDRIPEDFFAGIISAEDASFWTHTGVRLGSLKAAMLANLKAGKFVYGASTLTMQLAKNLFLTRGKVISRKVQEILIAWILEHELEKEDILEIYANIVEFGPNTYGIQAAAQAFFGKTTDNLNRAEAVYLASILPNPRAAYLQNVCTGHLHKVWADRMEKTALGIQILIKDREWMTHYRKDLLSMSFSPALQDDFCRSENQRLNISSLRPEKSTL